MKKKKDDKQIIELPSNFTDKQTTVVGMGEEDQLDKRRKKQHLGEFCILYSIETALYMYGSSPEQLGYRLFLQIVLGSYLWGVARKKRKGTTTMQSKV